MTKNLSSAYIENVKRALEKLVESFVKNGGDPAEIENVFEKEGSEAQREPKTDIPLPETLPSERERCQSWRRVSPVLAEMPVSRFSREDDRHFVVTGRIVGISQKLRLAHEEMAELEIDVVLENGTRAKVTLSGAEGAQFVANRDFESFSREPVTMDSRSLRTMKVTQFFREEDPRPWPSYR